MANLVRRRWEPAALFAIILMALGLRLYRLDTQSLWNDEGTSVVLAQRDLPTITRNAANDIHPPLYYYLLHFWVKIAGTSEFAVRFFSAASGVALVSATYALGKRPCTTGCKRPCTMGCERPYGRGIPVLAALFAAVSPFQVYYSQETRMYVLSALLSLLSMLAFQRFLSHLSRRATGGTLLLAAGGHVLAGILAVYSHYFAFSVLLAENVGFLIWLMLDYRTRHPGLREIGRTVAYWAAAQAAIALCYVPWLVLSWPSLRNWPAISQPLSLGELLLNVSQVFSVGLTVEGGLRTRLAALALSLLLLPGLLLRPPADKGQNRSPGPAFRTWLMALYLLVPVLVMYLLSLQRPMYRPKLLILATPAYYLLQARGVCVLARLGGSRVWRAIAVGILALIVCAASARSLVNLYQDERYFRDDYRGIIEYIGETYGPKDAILISAPSQVETVNYYYKGDLPEYPVPRQRPIDVDDTRAILEDIAARHSRVYAIYWATSESDPERFVETWADEHWYKALDRWYGNVRLAVYSVSDSTTQGIAHPTDYVLGQVIRLRGYSLATPEPRSGDMLQLTLFWEARAPVEERYKVFIHVVDSRGNIAGQRDSEPGGGAKMTTGWRPGETIVDNYGLLIQPGTPPGEHTLRIGMYSLSDGQRLPVAKGGQNVGDSIDLVQLSVALPDLPSPIAGLDIQHKSDATWGSLRLVGYGLHRLGSEHEPKLLLRPGDVARLVLFWRKEARGPVGSGFVVSLSDRGGHVVWEQALQMTGGIFPFAAWRDGEVVRDLHQLHLPPDMRPAEYLLTLRADGWGESKSCRLGSVTITLRGGAS